MSWLSRILTSTMCKYMLITLVGLLGASGVYYKVNHSLMQRKLDKSKKQYQNCLSVNTELQMKISNLERSKARETEIENYKDSISKEVDKEFKQQDEEDEYEILATDSNDTNVSGM